MLSENMTMDALVVLAGEHGIETIYLSGENSHALVFSRGTVQRDESKAEEIRGFHEFRHHHSAVVGGESRVIDVSAVIIPEMNESGVFDAIPLGGSGRENDALRQLLIGLELDLAVRLGHRPNSISGILMLQQPFGLARLVQVGSDIGGKFFEFEPIAQVLHYGGA